MNLDVYFLAYAAVGGFMGLLFILDGWRSNPNRKCRFKDSPKVRAFLFILGGGVLPTVQSLIAGDRKDLLAVYTVAVVTASVIILGLLALYALCVSYNRTTTSLPNVTKWSHIMEALPYVAVALQEGLEEFRVKLNDYSQFALQRQANLLNDYFVGFVNTLAALENPLPIDQPRFWKDELLAFLLNALECAPNLSVYRACLYRQTDSGQLEFFVGVSPSCRPHTKQPLPKNSLAGQALDEPFKVHRYPSKAPGPRSFFYHRENEACYKSVLACALNSLEPTANATGRMVLCIDSLLKDFPQEPNVLDSSILALSQFLAASQVWFRMASGVKSGSGGQRPVARSSSHRNKSNVRCRFLQVLNAWSLMRSRTDVHGEIGIQHDG